MIGEQTDLTNRSSQFVGFKESFEGLDSKLPETDWMGVMVFDKLPCIYFSLIFSISNNTSKHIS